ncbi:MAG: right-handed parallel beta-helix repeat-containing protein [Thermoplasmata archaeon]|nr:MAG: right-handed parallel beta-helix repeat-containing protein [Thermoplasmata archaeon]
MRKLTKLFVCANIVMITALTFLVATSPRASAGTVVGGPIDSDTTWDIEGSPYWVVDDVFVVNGANLTIEIGVDVLFNGSFGIYVEEGAIIWIVQGISQRNYALFSWNSDLGAPCPGCWYGIEFEDSSYDYSSIRYSVIEYATYGVRLERASPLIRNCTIRNCTYGIYSNHGSPTIENNIIENCTEEGMHFNGNDPGGGYANIQNNTVYNNTKRGIVFYDVSDARLRYNNIDNSTYNFGVWGDHLSEFNHDIDTTNTVNDKPIFYWRNHEHDDESIPFYAGYVGIVNSTNITAENLTLTQNGQGVLVAYSNYTHIDNVTANDNELGIILYIYPNHTIVNSNISNNDYNGYYPGASGIYLYNSLYNNISNNIISSNNGVGIVLDGYCNGNKIINNSISNNTYGILGSGSNNNITNNTISLNSDTGIDLIGDGNKISSNNISNNKKGIVFSYSDWNNLIDNHVSINQEYGIYLTFCSNNIIKNCNVSNNYYGISFYFSSNNNITNSNLSNNDYYGVFLYQSSWNDIFSCFISSSNYYGIWLWSSNNKIAKCVITKNDFGFYLYSSSNNNISKCNISSNIHDGLHLDDMAYDDIIYKNVIGWNGQAGIKCTSYNDLSIKDNMIVWNDDEGIHCAGNSDPSITYNDIENNTDYGVFSRGGSDPVINYNNICNNGGGASGPGYGVYNDDTNTINAENNWWNDDEGPSGEGPSDDGDRVSDYVDYIPFSTSKF